MWVALGGNVSTDLLDDQYEYNLLCSPLVDDEKEIKLPILISWMISTANACGVHLLKSGNLKWL